jgi:hypothetical protein
MPKMPKCRIAKDGIKPCKGLSQVLQYPGKKRGVEMQTFINMKTNKFARHLVVLKSGEHSKNGIVFNNCPFCTGELYRSPK